MVECERCEYFNPNLPKDAINWRFCNKYGVGKWDCKGYVEAVDENGWAWAKHVTPTTAASYLVEMENGQYYVADWYKSYYGDGMRWSAPYPVVKWKEIV